MLILGIDPGTARLGFGLVEANGHKKLKFIEAGCLTTEMETAMGERLYFLQTEIGKILRKYKPDVVAIEQLFFGINARTAMAVGQARGAVMAEVSKHRLPIFEYQGLTVKASVTGYGRSDKKEVLRGVHKILGIRREIKPDDAADGLAIAITHHLKTSKSK